MSKNVHAAQKLLPISVLLHMGRDESKDASIRLVYLRLARELVEEGSVLGGVVSDLDKEIEGVEEKAAT